MAGESPDRSEQRKPSGETAAGGGPVPERPGGVRSAVLAPPSDDSDDSEDAHDAHDSGDSDAKAREDSGDSGDSGDAEAAAGARGGAGDAGAAEPDGDEPEPPTGGTGAPAGPKRPVDQATAVLRAPGASGDAPVPEGAAEAAEASEGAEVPADAVESGEAADAVGRAGGRGEIPTGPADRRTTAFRPPRPPSEAESDAERTSLLVPLRSVDDPRPPRPPKAPASPPGPPEAERTQPLLPPSQRPIDLLAQLTNKPAPPETPLRVLLRRVRIWSPLVALLAVLLAVVQLLRPLPEPELRLTVPATHAFGGAEPSLAWPSEGQAVVHVDGLGSLGSYGEREPVPIASVAKVMTAYVILRDHPMEPGEEGPQIRVDRKAEEDAGLSAVGESTVEVREGETITQREALNAVMIASANNVARLLARWDAGSEKAFVRKMNDTARELGMTDTTYTDPSGLRKDTVSTAADQVRLGKRAMEDEVFREIVELPSYEDRNGVRHRNWNGLVPYDGAVGIKPGTSTAAGGNLLFAAERAIGGTTQLVVGAVLGQHEAPIIDTVIGESRELMLSAQEALEAEGVLDEGDVVGYVDDGLGVRTPLVVTEDVTAVGWPGLEVELALTDGGRTVPQEAEAGEIVGALTVGGGPGRVRVPVAVAEDLAEPGTGARLTRVL